MQDFIYNQFQENKQLFKPYVSWPEVVHLGLNNVDAISNTFLKNIKLSSGERLLWVCYHKASWGSTCVDERIPSGVIMTNRQIFYRNNATGKEFKALWADIISIRHANYFFFLQVRGIKSEFAISDYAFLNKPVADNSAIVQFFKKLVGQSEKQIEHCVLNNIGDSKVGWSQIGDAHKKQYSDMVSGLSTQKSIEKAYQKLLDILKDTNSDISELQGVNSQFNSVKQKITSAFEDKISEARKELQTALKDTVWDNLVIAFFGETNAGKSTIIETFRILFDDKRKKEDGLIVGDGRHDFTKTYEEYHLSISGHPFTLIDVPGIEGDEAEFKDVIKTALHKAHCVFYVQGHNKKPDRATAEKIKKYLGDWVKVYSIYNVRGGVSNYDEEEERETLLTSGVRKTEELIKAELKSILGDVYAGHVTLQGLLAMSAKAMFSKQREDLIRGQQKLLSYFGGSSEKVLSFSQFKTLTNLVEGKASNFRTEIVDANMQKLVSLAGKIECEINQVLVSQMGYLASLDSQLDAVKRDVCNNGLDSAKRNISNKSKNAVDKAYGDLKANIFDLIENESDNIQERARYCQRVRINELKDRIESIVSDELSKVLSVANRKIKELDGIRLKSIHFKSSIAINTEIDFTDALEELDVDWEDVTNWVGKTAGTAATGAVLGSIIPGVGTLIGAAVGGIFGGVVHACSGDGGKADARKSAGDAIGKAKQRVKTNIPSILSSVLYDIDAQGKMLKSSIDKEKDNIKELQDSLDKFDGEVHDFVKKIKQKQYGRI